MNSNISIKVFSEAVTNYFLSSSVFHRKINKIISPYNTFRFIAHVKLFSSVIRKVTLLAVLIMKFPNGLGWVVGISPIVYSRILELWTECPA